jgi:phosphoglucomutase
MTTSITPRAGKTLGPSLLLDVPQLLEAYTSVRPDPANPARRIVFGIVGPSWLCLPPQIKQDVSAIN